MIQDSSRGAVIEISVRPRAGRCRVIDASGERVRIEVSAPPEDGKATQQAMKTLADALGLPAGSLELLKGRTTHHKTVLVKGASAADCAERLGVAGKNS